MGSEKIPEEPQENKSVSVICPHCNNDFNINDITEKECTDCGSITISIFTKKCKNTECENVYCKYCTANLNEHGFCYDCEMLYCDGCDEEVERGTHISCPMCKNADFCSDCAPDMVDSDIGCVECASSDLVVECSGSSYCSSPILKSQTILCKNFKVCGMAFCKKCSEENLDDQGYCEDCNSFECSECQSSFHINDGVKCSNSKCKDEAIFCKKCRELCVDSEGTCLDCSTKPTFICENCECRAFTTKEVTKCQRCNRSVCPSCSQTMLECSGCHNKACGHCAKRCKTCQKVFCSSCNTFDKGGRCKEHTRKNIIVRILDAIAGN